MKQIFTFFLILNLSLVVYAMHDKQINDIIKKNNLNPSHLGIEINANGQDLYKLNNEQLFIPASITKLMTTHSVLKNFPQDHRFKTELFYDGKNLYLVGGGDPSFVSENLWFLVNEFIRQQITNISGDIIVDDSLFDTIRFDESRESVRVDRSYDSPVGAMSFNWNSINIYVSGVSSSPGKAQVVLDPENNYFQLENKTQIKTGKITKDLVIDVNQAKRKIIVSGQVLKGQPEKAYYKNVSTPDLWSGENLKAFLKQRGITVRGQIKAGRLSQAARKVATYESKSLSAILADMNKFSNNFVAEMLVKGISVKQGEKPATLKKGIATLNQDLLDIGLKKEEFSIKNPSGFSRDNKISAQAMNAVLSVLKNNFKYFPVILDSLPISGVDGTLKKRMKNSIAEGSVRAKTGYLDGVVTLAGYAGHSNGQVYIFSFLYNGPQDEQKVRECFDQIIKYILQSEE